MKISSTQLGAGGPGNYIDPIDAIVSQPAEAPIHTAFPHTHLSRQETLLHHPDFESICTGICGHGNHRLLPLVIREIWIGYLEGGSNRSIATTLGINDTLVWRTINTLNQWMELMDLDVQHDAPIAKVVLRDYRPKSDEAFIYASWRNSLWYDDDDRREGESDRFYRQATISIRNILENPNARVKIACLSDSDNFIVGYCVSAGSCLHFVYVKADYRNKGIGTLLVPRDIKSLSPVLTKIGRAIAVKRGFATEE